MAARAIWKGVLRCGELTVPVRLYGAVRDRAVRFRLLHARDRVPVRQRMVNSITGREVPPERVQKAYPLEDAYVRLTADDLDAVAPAESRDVVLSCFVAPGLLPGALYQRAYWLGPDGDEGSYAAIVEALRRRRLVALARWVMRGHACVGALHEHGASLMLARLWFAEQVVSAAALQAPAGRHPEDKEIALAEQLVAALAGPFEPGAYRDEYQERMLELVRTKAAGGAIAPPRRERRREALSLSDALLRSLKTIEEQRHA